MYANGYKYWLAYKKHNTSYFRCCRYKSSCAGRCVIENGKVRNTADHNHEPEPDRALVDRFRKILTHRAANEKNELHVIYWEEATQRHCEAALLYTFTQAESAMRKARRKQLPRAPQTIQELGDVLSASELFQIHTGSNHDPFYQTSISTGDATCAVFMHKKSLELLDRIELLHVDASFFVQPQTPPSYYIFSAHAIQSDHSSPILYAITTTRNQNVFSSIFSYLRKQLANLPMPNVILSEFDYDMLVSLSQTFPEANLKENWYQYAENVVRQMKCYGMERETAKGHGASALRMLMVLPLLPAEYMSPGLDALKKWMEEKTIYSQGFVDLCSYIEISWLRTIGADKMSIFGLKNCLNNQVKNFNANLRSQIGLQNPAQNLWHILETLTVIATKNFVRISKKKSLGASTKPTQRKGRIVVDTIIKNATQMWIRSAVHLRNPLQFLQLCSHCIQDISNFTVQDDGKSYIKNVSTIRPTDNNFDINTAVAVQQTFQPTTTLSFTSRNYVSIQPMPSQGISSQVVTQQQSTQPTSTIVSSSEPPPLVFFGKPKRIVDKSLPPPLVPIGSKR